MVRVFVTLYISALIYHTYAGIRHLLMDIGFFETKEQAEEMRLRFEVNSDSGYKYRVKKIGEHHDDH
jgi:succinate dehydrogenase/fumarate reductase cytochrome b subunit